jgi:CheY-like chemotaxis protein
MAKTVLIVEDNELNMKLFRDLLEAHGYRTIGTHNGFEVLDLARNRRPDLILMDIQLPEVSGLEAFTALTMWSATGKMVGCPRASSIASNAHCSALTSIMRGSRPILRAASRRRTAETAS